MDNKNNNMPGLRGKAKSAYVYNGYSRRNHNRLCSVDPLIQHSRSWRELQARSVSEPAHRPNELLDAIGFVSLLAIILFVFLFLPSLLGS